MSDLYIYASPLEASVELVLDDGRTIAGEACVANGRDDAHRLTLPDGTPTQGAVVRITCSGYISQENRGIYHPDLGMVMDDFRLTPEPTPPPAPAEPVRDPHADPLAIIEAVYALQDHDLATKDGCGTFTEDCCTALNEQQSADWGHIRKNPGQNQYVGPSGVGHAVDALMLRWPAGDTIAGIYDIIHDSESANASPSFNYKGPPDSALWYYPA